MIFPREKLVLNMFSQSINKIYLPARKGIKFKNLGFFTIMMGDDKKQNKKKITLTKCHLIHLPFGSESISNNNNINFNKHRLIFMICSCYVTIFRF